MQSLPVPTEPCWRGPLEDGVTNSLLGKFLVCRHRFYIRAILGIREHEDFSDALEYGNLWHEAEEAHCGGNDWQAAVEAYRKRLLKQYPEASGRIRKWATLCKMQFPVYLDYWRRNLDERHRTPIYEEETFAVEYPLPCGTTVLLRGKMDVVFAIKRSVYIQEHKCKGDIDEEGILATVDRNLQTGIYQTALRHGYEFEPGYRVKGTLYNVVRRPLSDRHAPRQRKSESERDFYKRAIQQMEENPDYYFMRWRVLLHKADMDRFQFHILNPLLQQLVQWYKWVSKDISDPFRLPDTTDPDEQHLPPIPGGGIHYQFPWGVYNSIARGFRGDYFDYLAKGSSIGLEPVGSMFPELEDTE